MQKPRSYAEIYNDLDGEVVNVFRVLQNRRKARNLEQLLRLTPFARKEFLLGYKRGQTDVERARRTIIRSFMGFGSDSISRSTGFRWNANRSGTAPARDWAHYPAALSAFVERLQGVTIEQRDALDILAKMDREDALHYVDPPYPMSTRRIGNGITPNHGYRHEMTDEDHVRLSELLHSLKGMVVISSYPGPLYDRLYAGWHSIEWTSKHFVSTSGDAKRTECVWLNPAARANSQQNIFD